MDNFKYLLQLYYKPAAAMSEIMDGGSWIFGAVCVVVLSLGLGFSVNNQIRETYAVSQIDFVVATGIINTNELDDEEFAESGNLAAYQQKRPFPLIGNTIFWLFSFTSSFITPLLVLTLFYFPATIIVAAGFGRLGNAVTVAKRDYATFTTCGLMAWTAAHLPFAIAGLALSGSGLDGSVFLGMWLASGLFFGLLLMFALRTVFGLEYATAIATVAISWIFYSLGAIVLQFVSPWLFSPFLLIIAVFYLGGFVKGEVSGLGNSMRNKRNFKRFLHNATVNPNDADAHVQLGLIYKQRRQDEKALEHFNRAFEIDHDEIDANFELGIYARQRGELQKAIEHFSVVVEQNDKYSLSEVWREIGVTYFEAGMNSEAFEALEKFVTRRAFDSEGLYYFGKLLQKTDANIRANEMFERAIEAAKTAPYYRKKELVKWSRLAAKEIG